MSLAPVPDLAPIPGMCPGVAVLAGGGDGGGGSGKGKGDGSGDDSAGTEDGKNDASGDPKDGGDGCGDPVCPVTGRMFLDLYDFGFAGPLELRWIRSYSSRTSDSDGELGFGWSHGFGWRAKVKPHRVVVIDDQAREQVFPGLDDNGEPQSNGKGWQLSRAREGLELRLEDGRKLSFGPEVGGWHRLAGVSDHNGNRITLDRDSSDRLIGMTDAAGRPYRVQCDGAGRILSIAVATQPGGQQWMEVARYAYDRDGNLVSATDAEDYTCRYAYHRHLLVEHQMPTGLSYCYRYDGVTQDAFCIESWGEYVGSIDPALENPIPRRPPGRDTRPVKGINYVRFEYFKSLRYTEVTNGLGGVLRFFGDEAGRIVKKVDESGGVTERHFDPQTGDLVSESLPDGTQRALNAPDPEEPNVRVGSNGFRVVTYNDDDLVEVRYDEEKDAIIRRKYDAHGNLEFVEHADHTTEQYTSDSRGLLTVGVDRKGALTRYTHDSMGNCVAIERPGVGTERMEYDYLGRKVAHVEINGERTEWDWDRRSEVVAIRYPSGTTKRFTRDWTRYAVAVEEDGRVARREYGGLHWPIRHQEPDGAVTEYRYDTEGNLTWVKNPRGQVAKQTFDPACRPIGFESFEGLHYRAGFDVTGRQIWVDTPTGRQTRAYDANGFLTAAEMPDGEAVTIAYDPVKRTIVTDNGVVAVVRERDRADNVVVERQGRHEVHIGWDGGLPATLISNVGVPILYRWNTDGTVATMETGNVTIRLELPAGEGTLTYLGTGLVLRRTYTKAGLLSGQCLARHDGTVSPEQAATRADPSIVLWTAYEYGPDNLLVAEHLWDGRSVRYEHDVAGRVTCRRAYRNGILLGEERVGYDAAGSPRMAGAQYDALFRPVALGNETFEYDDAGRLSRRRTDAGDWTYEWSAAGELVVVHAPEWDVRMRYDAHGRRVEKKLVRQNELVSHTEYVWGNNCLLHELDVPSGSSRTYLRDHRDWTPDAHVDLTATEEVPTYYLDHPSSAPEVAVNASGEIVWQAERTIFGATRAVVEKVKVDVRFANQHYDRDVDLVYNYRRWYDPRLGVFVSPDPLLLDGNPNPRDYVPNPLRYIDPSGLKKPRLTDAQKATGEDFSRTGDYTLRPGNFADKGTKDVPGYIDAGDNAMNRNFSADTRRAVDNAGYAYGCHSCGSKDPGTKSGHFIPDHQAPISQNKAASKSKKNPQPQGQVRLYPHCSKCSARQRDQQSNLSHDKKKNAQAARDAAQRNKTDKPYKTPTDKTAMQAEAAKIKAQNKAAGETPRKGFGAFGS